MARRVLSTITVILFILILAGVIIFYSRGYRLDFNEKTLSTTGILSISSYPDKASIFIDGRLISATNASLTLSPNWYSIKISREGYQSWEKKVRVQGEVVSQIDALLIPTNPSLRAITVTGIETVTISPSRMKVAYIVNTDDQIATSTFKPKTGVWVLDLRTGLLGGRDEPKQVLATRYPQGKTKIIWSPDEKQLALMRYNTTANKDVLTQALLLNIDDSNIQSQDITPKAINLTSEWIAEEKTKLDLQLAVLPIEISNKLKSAAKNIFFSPDESKILYLATTSAMLIPVITPPLIGSNPTLETRSITSGNFYIYDTREDKNFLVADQKTIQTSDSIIWYSDSKHLAQIENNSINMVDYDGTNKRTVYSGPFEKNLFYTSPQGGKLIILTNLNRSDALPNLYELDLR